MMFAVQRLYIPLEDVLNSRPINELNLFTESQDGSRDVETSMIYMGQGAKL